MPNVDRERSNPRESRGACLPLGDHHILVLIELGRYSRSCQPKQDNVRLSCLEQTPEILTVFGAVFHDEIITSLKCVTMRETRGTEHRSMSL